MEVAFICIVQPDKELDLCLAQAIAELIFKGPKRVECVLLQVYDGPLRFKGFFIESNDVLRA